jgi:hypothetical protein
LLLKAVLDLDPEKEDPAKADPNPDRKYIYKKFLPPCSVSDPDSIGSVDPDLGRQQ